MRTLRQCLLDIDPALLRVIASRWAIDSTGLKPRDLIAQLASTIGHPTRSSQLIQTLPPAAQDALRTLLAAGGTQPAPGFTQRFGAIRAFGPVRLEREQPWRAPVNAAETLWYWGLIYKGFEQLPGGPMREVFIAPAELQPVLPLLAATERRVEPLPLTPAPDQVRRHAAGLADDACTLLSYLHNHFVRSTVPPLGLLKSQLRDAEADRFEFLRRLLDRTQLTKTTGHRLRPEPKTSTRWLHAPTVDQLRALFDAWRGDAGWSDLAHVRALHIERAVSLNPDPVAVRAALLDALAAAVPGAWHALDALFTRMKAQSPDFLRANFDLDYIRDTATQDYLRGFAAWDRIEGALIRALLSGPLHWLGVIDLAAGPAADAFCLTPVGAALLGRPVELAAERDQLIVNTDATVEVAAARRYDRFQLSRIAASTGFDEQVYRYRLTPASLTRAASQKIDAAKVADYLTRAATQPVPPVLIKSIQRWAKRGTEVKIEQAVIVRVQDAAILKRLQESPKLRGITLDVLGPTAARIQAKDWPRLISLLAEAGVLVDLQADEN